MTTWFLDPEGGNDANAGTSFALRKKTVASITLAAGDNVRIIADYGSQNLGNATWTDNSPTVTLAAAATLTIDNCDTAWTAGTNVTSTVTTSNRKQGTNCLQLAFASGFTGGLVAFKAVSNLDLSAYACVSMWLSTASNTLAQGIQLALCSDSAGATPIVTLPFPPWLIGNNPGLTFPLLFENGGAALPSGVNSIAIYANNGKPYTGNMFVDNVIATKAYGTAGHLSHGCLFGKNTAGEPEWYPVMSIDGPTVVLGGMSQISTATPAKPYRGTTETVTTYALAPMRTRMTAAQSKLTGASGTAASPVTWTGGWNRTDMSTQTGTSWLSGEGVQANGYNNSGALSWQSLPDSTIGYAWYSGTAVAFASQRGVICYLLGLVSCSAIASNAVPQNTADISLGNLVQNSAGYNLSSLQPSKYRLRIRRITGSTATGYTPGDYLDDANADIAISSIDNCNNALANTGNVRVRIRGLSVKNNSSATVSAAGGSGSVFILDRPVLGDTTLANIAASSGQVIRCTNVAGAAWDNRVYTYGVTQTVTQGTVHGTSTQSLSLLLNDYLAFMGLPYQARIARIACNAGLTVTFKAWMQRTTQFVNAGIMVQAGSVAGIVDTQAQGSAANGTWEQVSISFTPTENGVVDVFAYIAGQATTSANGTIALFGDTSASST